MQEVCENLTIQIMGWKVCLRCKGKTLLGAVNKLLKIKSHVHVCERNYFFAAERKSGGEKGMFVLRRPACRS